MQSLNLLLVVVSGALWVTVCGTPCTQDPSVSCPDGMTCCTLTSGGIGCCPMPDAICCQDKVHCCPQDTKCDVSSGQCLKKNGDTIPWAKKVAAVSRGQNKLCPDQKMQCSGDQTCCQLTNGEYGCCPHQKGVCCSDHLHCCPHNTKCDLAHGKCTFTHTDKLHVKWHSITTQIENSETLVSCPDGAKCPANTKCCPVGNIHVTGHYSCCAITDGVCCNNHCCPSGYSCSASSCYKVGHKHHKHTHNISD